jgi:ribonucleotide reductase alpha subunit
MMRLQLLKDRYFTPGETKEEQIYERVARAIAGIASGGQLDNFGRNLYDHMVEGIWLPNSPTLANAGRPGQGGLSACYVLPIEDSLDGIYRTVWHAARVHKAFGGTGFNFSSLRPLGSPIVSTGGKACGPVKVMGLLNHSSGVVMQGGKREGANMGILNATHPDIRQFIHAKENDGTLTHFNISVGMTDADMRDDDLLAEIAEVAWKTGDPGIIFLDRLNEHNQHSELPRMDCTNPCLHGDTLIQTTEGEFPIRDLVGKKVDVYCIDPSTYELRIAPASNIIATKTVSEFIKINTTRRSILCTPDHPVYTRNRGWVSANQLRLTDKITGLNIFPRNERHVMLMLSGQERCKAIPEHRFVAGYYYNLQPNEIVHHINGDPTDNRASNLDVRNRGDHSRHHNLGHEPQAEKDPTTGRFVPSIEHYRKHGNALGINSRATLKLTSIEYVGITDTVYDLTVDKYHNCFANGIVVHNCGEQPLREFESCNLGSINLAKFPDIAVGDTSEFRQCVKMSISALDRIIDINTFPIPEIEQATKLTRKIGSGVMGWADWLIMNGISYQSTKALQWIDKIASIYYEEARNASHQLAKERGEYPAAMSLSRRNETLMTIAPTGTLSYLAGCSWGIEPIFDWTITRQSESGSQIIRHPLYQVAADHGLLKDTAHYIGYEWQIQHVAKWQQWVDNGVSKTINLPNTATVEDIIKAFKLAHQMGCKGVTVYRDGSKQHQVVKKAITTPGEVQQQNHIKAATERSIENPRKGVDSTTSPTNTIKDDKHGVERYGTTLDFTTGCGRIHITCNQQSKDTNIPYEVYVLSDGGCPAMLEALGKIISKYFHDSRLQGDEMATVARIVKTLKKVDCPTALRNPKSQGKSCADIIAKRLETVWLHSGNEVVSIRRPLQDTDTPTQDTDACEEATCPQCGTQLDFGRGCRAGACPSCNWSGCL